MDPTMKLWSAFVVTLMVEPEREAAVMVYVLQSLPVWAPVTVPAPKLPERVKVIWLAVGAVATAQKPLKIAEPLVKPVIAICIAITAFIGEEKLTVTVPEL